MEFLHEAEFWVLVAAIVFVALVGRKVFSAVAGGLDSRAARIRGELDEARRLREEAEQLLAEYRAKQQQAAADAEAIVAQAKAEAERIAAQSARDLEQALERRQHMAEDRIAQAEAKAVAEVRARSSRKKSTSGAAARCSTKRSSRCRSASLRAAETPRLETRAKIASPASSRR